MKWTTILVITVVNAGVACVETASAAELVVPLVAIDETVAMRTGDTYARRIDLGLRHFQNSLGQLRSLSIELDFSIHYEGVVTAHFPSGPVPEAFPVDGGDNSLLFPPTGYIELFTYADGWRYEDDPTGFVQFVGQIVTSPTTTSPVGSFSPGPEANSTQFVGEWEMFGSALLEIDLSSAPSAAADFLDPEFPTPTSPTEGVAQADLRFDWTHQYRTQYGNFQFESEHDLVVRHQANMRIVYHYDQIPSFSSLGTLALCGILGLRRRRESR